MRNPCNIVVCIKPSCECVGVLAMALTAQRQGLETHKQLEAAKRVGATAHVTKVESIIYADVPHTCYERFVVVSPIPRGGGTEQITSLEE